MMVGKRDVDMNVGNSLFERLDAEITVSDAVSILVVTAAFGYLVGYLFTVHLVSTETMAVWITTLLFSVIGVLSWGVLQS